MYRFTAIFAVAFLLFAGFAKAEPMSTADALADRVVGDENAPVTLIEYSSLSCPHCKHFHDNTLPDIKKNYIDTGKVKLIIRDYPLGGAAYAAAMMARCVPPERHNQFIEVLFKNQDSWAKSQDPKSALARIGKLGGLSQAEFDRCITDQALFDGMRKQQLEAQTKYDVNATPTFIIKNSQNSDVQRISGSQPYEVFEQAFAKAMQ
ncbi:MAG: thioredoxin domain-containing protein [Pseudomonadota bacterium]